MAVSCGSHIQLEEEFESWINLFSGPKYSHTTKAHMYLQSLDTRARRALRKYTPGNALFQPFKYRDDYDDQSGNPVPAAIPPALIGGHDVTADAVTWKILHDMNVARLRETGVINADTARLQLSKLKQGDVDYEVYSNQWRRWHDDAHGGANPMLRRAELFDGLNRRIREDRR
jgi:hypothetical protein